jgi:hypothetical protein
MALLFVAFALYFLASKNESFSKRLLVSAYPLVFILGELFALVGSSYYERGSWESGRYVRTDTGSALVYGLYAIYCVGIVMGVYTTSSFVGSVAFKWLIVLVIPVAALLFFVSGMTLTRDWI